MSTNGAVLTTVRSPNTAILVMLPQNVDDCNLIVRISARNSAGMSSPTEFLVGKLTTKIP